MAQTGYTPISIYYSATASNTPTAGNLVAGELAINTNDGVLYYKDSSGVVQSIASKAGNSGSFTNLAYTGTLTGGTGVVNLGSGQFYKDASGNVGIGTASPNAVFTNYKSLYLNGSSGSAIQMQYGGSLASNIVADNNALYLQNITAIAFGTGGTGTGTERMRIDSSGNLLVGGTSILQSSKITNYGRYWAGSGNSTGDGEITFSNYASQTAANAISVRQDVGGANNDLKFLWFDGSGSYQGVAMQIDRSGNLLVGTTAQFNSGKQCLVFSGTTSQGINIRNSADNPSDVYVGFYNAFGTNTGTIRSGGSSTSYNTSSDYRLKENVMPMLGALDKVTVLKPVTYDWKTGGSSQGFIAHELQEVVPECVTGSKDEIDNEGNPIYQGIDTSFLVATLTAAIQEQQALIESLTTRLAALEAK